MIAVVTPFGALEAKWLPYWDEKLSRWADHVYFGTPRDGVIEVRKVALGCSIHLHRGEDGKLIARDYKYHDVHLYRTNGARDPVTPTMERTVREKLVPWLAAWADAADLAEWRRVGMAAALADEVERLEAKISEHDTAAAALREKLAIVRASPAGMLR